MVVDDTALRLDELLKRSKKLKHFESGTGELMRDYRQWSGQVKKVGLAENGVNDMYGWSGQKIAACPKTEGARCRCSGPGSAQRRHGARLARMKQAK